MAGPWLLMYCSAACRLLTLGSRRAGSNLRLLREHATTNQKGALEQALIHPRTYLTISSTEPSGNIDLDVHPVFTQEPADMQLICD